MTEFGPGIFALAPEDAIRKAGSIGRPNFFVDARIVDDENHRLPPGEVGELALKGPSYCRAIGATLRPARRPWMLKAGSTPAIWPPAMRTGISYPDTPTPSVELAWDDPWVLCYTGGTTGLAKGAILTHGSMAANSINTVMSWGVTPNDVAPLISPLFHTGGLECLHAAHRAHRRDDGGDQRLEH